jgi:hypothetical protein
MRFPIPFFATAPGALPPHYYTDPLVTVPGVGFTGWWARLTATLRETWRQLVIIGVIVAAPEVFVSLTARSSGVPSAVVATAVGVGIVGLIAGSWGTGASVWTIVRRANGAPSGLSGAALHGLKRALPMIGWQLLYGLALVVPAFVVLLLAQCAGAPGLVLGLLLIVACAFVGGVLGALIPTIVALRGSDSPIATSWEVVRAGFGAALGRILLVCLIGSGPGVVVGMATSTLTFSQAPGSLPSAPVSAVSAVLAGAATAWSTMIVSIGLLLTYAELRARLTPITSADLLEAMEPRAILWAGRPGIPAARSADSSEPPGE